MPVDRSVRHTVPLLRREIRQEEIYAQEMYGTSPWAGAAPSKGLTGQSIRWRFDPATRQGVCGDWKVPEDRVLGTPVKVYFVYSMDGGPGGDGVMWLLTYVVVPRGGDVTGTPVLRTALDVTHGLDILARTDPIELDAALFDGPQMEGLTPIQLQMTFNRWADDPNDDDPNNADLYKVLLEYTAYI